MVHRVDGNYLQFWVKFDFLNPTQFENEPHFTFHGYCYSAKCLRTIQLRL
jgi:hypothetical protein